VGKRKEGYVNETTYYLSLLTSPKQTISPLAGVSPMRSVTK